MNSKLFSIICSVIALFAFWILIEVPDEDAYITFIYSQSLIEGLGATYRGILVEGYTNFFYMIILAVLGTISSFEIPQIAIALSLFLSVGCVYLISSIITLYWDGRLFQKFVAFLGVITIIVDPNVTYWLLAGTENSLLSFLILLFIYLSLKNRTLVSYITLGLIGVVRFDALLVSIVLLGWDTVRRGDLKNTRILAPRFLIVIAPFILNTLFRVLYYNAWKPNTGHRKYYLRDFDDRIFEGLVYVWNFLYSAHIIQGFILILLLLTFTRKLKIQKNHKLVALLTLFMSSVLLYCIWIGGDVGWKVYFRFCNIFILIFSLSFCIFIQDLRRPGAYAAIIWFFIVALMHPGKVNFSTDAYNQQFNKGISFYSNYNLSKIINYSWNDKHSGVYNLLKNGITEGVFISAGMLVNQLTPSVNLLWTTGAGRLVYYAKTRAIDGTGLADKEWLFGNKERKETLLKDIEVVAFEALFGRKGTPFCELSNYENFKKFKLKAITYSRADELGLANLIFTDKDFKFPDTVGNIINYKQMEIDYKGEKILLYVLNGISEDNIVKISAKFEEWIEIWRKCD